LRAFHIFIAGNQKHIKFSMQIDHSKSQPMDDKQSLKRARSRHVIHFKFQDPKQTSGITEARIVKFRTQVGYISCYRRTTSPLNGRNGHVTVLKFCRLS